MLLFGKHQPEQHEPGLMTELQGNANLKQRDVNRLLIDGDHICPNRAGQEGDLLMCTAL